MAQSASFDARITNAYTNGQRLTESYGFVNRLLGIFPEFSHSRAPPQGGEPGIYNRPPVVNGFLARAGARPGTTRHMIRTSKSLNPSPHLQKIG